MYPLFLYIYPLHPFHLLFFFSLCFRLLSFFFISFSPIVSFNELHIRVKWHFSFHLLAIFCLSFRSICFCYFFFVACLSSSLHHTNQFTCHLPLLLTFVCFLHLFSIFFNIILRNTILNEKCKEENNIRYEAYHLNFHRNIWHPTVFDNFVYGYWLIAMALNILTDA